MRPSLPSFTRSLSRSTVAFAVLVGAAAASLAAGVAAPVVLAAAPAPSEHHAYVVKLTNRGAYAYSDATMLAVIDTALQRWVRESEGAISAFDRVGGLHDLATATDCQDEGAVWDEAVSELFPDVDFGSRSGNHLIVMGPPACRGGVATNGSGLGDGGLIFFRFQATASAQTLLHELGHNLGLRHDHALKCSPDCVDVTYGNQYSFMGYTTPHDPAFVPGSLDSYQRRKFGIDQPCEIRLAQLTDPAETGRASYRLHPRGTDDGARGVRIVDPRDDTVYYLDFRNGAGRDAEAYYATSDAFREGITVEKVTTDDRGREISQLQSRPDGRGGAVYSLLAGETFSNGGIRVTVDELGAPHDPDATATVTVALATDPGVEGVPEPLVDGCEDEALVPTPSPTSAPSTAPAPTPTEAPVATPTPTPAATATPTAPATSPATPTATPTLLPPVGLPSALPTEVLTAIPTQVPTGLPDAIPSLPVPSLPVPSLPTTPSSPTPSSPAPDPTLPTTATTPASPTPAATPASPTPAATPAATATPSATPTPTATATIGLPPTEPTLAPPFAVDGPDDTSSYVPPPPEHGFLPGTGSPRLLLAEIAAGAFLLAFGLVLATAGCRARPRRSGPAR